MSCGQKNNDGDIMYQKTDTSGISICVKKQQNFLAQYTSNWNDDLGLMIDFLLSNYLQEEHLPICTK